MDMGQRVKTVVVGVGAWTVTFMGVRKILSKRSFDFCNRVVSLIHVAVALWLCSVSVKDWKHPLEPLASPAAPLQIRALSVSLSYFIYDFSCCLFDSSISLSNCIHHLVSILGLGVGVVYATSIKYIFMLTLVVNGMEDKYIGALPESSSTANHLSKEKGQNKEPAQEQCLMCGSELTGCLWLMEISNPFMHMRELLKELGYKDSSLGILNDICFAFVFTLARLIVGPYLVYLTVTANNPLLLKATSVGLQVVSIFWFYKITKMVQYKIAKAKKSQTTF